MDPYVSYPDAEAALYDLPRFAGRQSLEPIRTVMEALDDPHQDYDVIHVAGTNGKGSTVHCISRILQEAGYTVGRYTSPHLTDVRERIAVDGEAIPASAVMQHLPRILAAGDVTFFEATTALAYQHFSAEDVDVAVVETGLGGRLDATNVADADVAVITNVAEEHTAVLGEDVTAVAREIAGIIPDDGVAVSGAEGPAADAVAAVAEDRDADLHPVTQRATPLTATPRLCVDVDGASVRTGMTGRYQARNIDTALTALERYDDVAASTVRTGLRRVTVPGRLELRDAAPRLVLDGAHNPAGMRTAADDYARVCRGHTVAVVSVMEEKDAAPMLEALETVVDEVVVTAASIDRARAPDDLAAHVTAPCTVEPDLDAALATARDRAGAAGTVLVTGSLYLVGDVKARGY